MGFTGYWKIKSKRGELIPDKFQTMKYFILVIALIAVVSCKSRKDHQSGEPATVTVELKDPPPIDDEPPPPPTSEPDSITKAAIEKKIMLMPSHRVVVSFISIGAGTDSRAREQLGRYIDESEKKFKIYLSYVSKGWGREGESDFLFPLDELNQAQQKEFVAGLKELFKGNELIHIEENRAIKAYRN
jgi:hypothetical protein